jgi:MtN3 and saliva related transmembrane protein
MRDCCVLLLDAGAGMIISRVEIDVMGYAAAAMTTVSFVPQLLRVIRLRSSRDISLGMFLIFSARSFP